MANSREWAKALSQKLVNHQLSDQVIKVLAEDVARIDVDAIGVDVCQVGICWDFLIDRGDIVSLLDQWRGNDRLGGIKIFPKGIIDPNQFLVQVETALQR